MSTLPTKLKLRKKEGPSSLRSCGLLFTRSKDGTPQPVSVTRNDVLEYLLDKYGTILEVHIDGRDGIEKKASAIEVPPVVDPLEIPRSKRQDTARKAAAAIAESAEKKSAGGASAKSETATATAKPKASSGADDLPAEGIPVGTSTSSKSKKN